MNLARVSRELPDDAGERVVLALDCANERRLGPDPASSQSAPLVVDVDHHHDNSRFGQVNLIVADASSTGEILYDLFAELGVRLITPEIAEALYIALVTDTGRFQYTNTTPKALRIAAQLVEAGANVHQVFQDVYENVAFAKLKLLARALERARVYEGGRLIVADLERADFVAAGAEEPFAEGIIDYLRAVEGAEIVALIREPPTQNGPTRRVSLRTRGGGIDVSAIARKSGGGGHRAGRRLLQRSLDGRDRRLHPPRVPRAGAGIRLAAPRPRRRCERRTRLCFTGTSEGTSSGRCGRSEALPRAGRSL